MLEYYLVSLPRTGFDLIIFILRDFVVSINMRGYYYPFPAINSNNEYYLFPPHFLTPKGEAGANVLVGIQVPITEMEEFHRRANSLGYSYMEETTNDAFHLIMR